MYEKVSDYIYRVPSESDAEKHYIVDLTPGSDPTCTCVAWVMRLNKAKKAGDPHPRGFCKHVDTALEDQSHAEQVAADQFSAIQAIEKLKQNARDLS